MWKPPSSVKILTVVCAVFLLCTCKKDGKVANPVAVEVYKVSILDFPESPPGGGNWDTQIGISDPFGRPDLLLRISDNHGQVVGMPSGYIRLNADRDNVPLNFPIDTLNTISLDRWLYMSVDDNDDFDPDDPIGAVQTDTLANFKIDRPGYITATANGVSARFYLRWK